MKKYIIIAAVACVMLLSGCSQAEEDHSELDNLIEQLQTTHLNTGSPEGGTETEEAIPYKSLTGTVASFSESEITVKADGKEQKFTINETTQILGGSRDSAKTVTVTYCEPEKKSKSITANVITILESTEAGTETIVTEPTLQTDTEASEDTSAVSAENPVESESITQPEETAGESEPQAKETTTEETENTTSEPEAEETTAETDADTQSETESEAPTETLNETQSLSDTQS